MSDSDHAHLEQLRRQYNRRLQLLENQAAQFGIYAPPHVQLEIEDINTKLADVDVANIVRTTLNYENGLDALIAQVRFFEEDSISMRKIDKFLRAAAIVG